MRRALRRAAIVVVAVVSVVLASGVVATASPSADPQHGIGFSKGCTSPRQFGGSVSCSFTVDNTVDSTNQAHDTLTINSISDAVATAGGPVTSGNIIASLTLNPQGGAFCDVTGTSSGTGNTLCTLPFGSFITTNAFALYGPITAADFAAFPLTHRLLDAASLGWHDLCDGLDANPTPGGGNCNPDPANNNSAGSTLIVDANVSISPNGTNEVIPPGQTVHTFTGHVNVSCQTIPTPDAACTGGTGYKNAPDGTTINFAFVGAHVGTLSAPSCVTAGGTGSCSVTDSSATAGVDTVRASTTVTVSGLALSRATADGQVGDSGDATKTWVDARITITPNGVNPTGTNHVFTAGVQTNSGAGFLSAPDGTLVTASITSGPGSFVGGNTCTTTSGSCTVTITSAVTGVTVVRAATDVTVSGLALHRVTDGTSSNSGPASKTWVTAAIAIAPDATNPVGAPHTFTVTLRKDLGDGAGLVAAAGEHVDVTLTDSNGAVHTAPTGTCLTAGPNTSAAGQCTITFTSNTAGKVTGHATATLSVGGSVPITVQTNGVSPNSADAVKTFEQVLGTVVTAALPVTGSGHAITFVQLGAILIGLGLVLVGLAWRLRRA